LKNLAKLSFPVVNIKFYEVKEYPQPSIGIKLFVFNGLFRSSGKPVKPPNSAYSFFSRMMLQSDEDVKQIPPKMRMAEISRKWKEISDAQKSRYEENVREVSILFHAVRRTK